MSNPILVLAIDLDYTIVNSRTSDFNNIDYNGTTTDANGKLKSNDSHMWLYYLNIIMTAAENRGFTLVPLLLTAKKDGVPDFLVARVAQALQSVMRPRTKNGIPTPISADDPTYYAMRHIDENCYKVQIPYAPDANSGYEIDMYQTVMYANHTDLIAPVHICYNNTKDGLEKITSKTAVLNIIKQYFNIPSANVFLLDDEAMHQTNARKAGYNTINAGNLSILRRHTVQERADACREILKETQSRILERITQLQAQKNPTNNVRSSSYQIAGADEDLSENSSKNNDAASSPNIVVLGSTMSPQSEHHPSAPPGSAQSERLGAASSRSDESGSDRFQSYHSNSAGPQSEQLGSVSSQSQLSDPAAPAMLSRLYNFFQEANCCAGTQIQIIPTGTNPSTTLG
jgi:hypothetical protein